MIYELEKKFRFETAHRLAKGYKGKCANIHGHSWNGKIVVSGEKLDEVGMVLDYSHLGEICKSIEKHLDHKILLHKEDPLVIILAGKTEVVSLPENPTSEYLAKYLFEQVKNMLATMDIPGKLVAVEIEETCTTRCTYKLK